MAKMQLALVNTKRVCGDCKACCTTKGVASLNKPSDMACSYLCEVGCSIYDSRPDDCKSYQCLWLQGYLSEDQRPDKVGYILDIDREEFTGLPVFATVPSEPGLFQREKETMVYRHKRLAKQLKQPVVANGLSIFAEIQFRKSIEKIFGEVEVTYV